MAWKLPRVAHLEWQVRCHKKRPTKPETHRCPAVMEELGDAGTPVMAVVVVVAGD